MKKGMFFLIVLMAMTPALASSPKLLGTYGDWKAYSYTENKNKVCYMASIPTRSEGKYTKRGFISLLITHRPADKTFDTVSLTTGYTYKKGSQATIKIDDNKPISLFTHEDTAWAEDAKTDHELVRKMRIGNKAVFKGTSSRGTATTDTFSLKGFTKAYQAIGTACGKK